jgi:hypothetical protein
MDQAEHILPRAKLLKHGLDVRDGLGDDSGILGGAQRGNQRQGSGHIVIR